MKRFPGLGVAMDGDVMAGHFRRSLFADTGAEVEEVKPKVFVDGDACRLQYPLRLSGPEGLSRPALVLGSMFEDAERARAFERSRLRPIAPPTAVIDELALALSVFPVSAELPTLVEVTDPERMAPVLGAHPAAIELVRYTRTPRCVVRYRFAGGRPPVYGKVAADLSPSTAIVLDALARGSEGAISVPRLLDHVAHLDLMLFSEVPGVRPRLASDSDLGPLLAVAAQAAVAVHGSPVEPPVERTLASEAARAAATVASITDNAPALAVSLSAAVVAVGACAGRSESQPLRVAHGDFTPSQLLVDGSSVGLLDLDDLCRAEPAADLGRFAAYVRVSSARSGPRVDEKVVGRLAEAYALAGGVPTAPERIRLYEVLSLVVMAVHSWQRMKAKRLEVVCSVLAGARSRLPA